MVYYKQAGISCKKGDRNMEVKNHYSVVIGTENYATPHSYEFEDREAAYSFYYETVSNVIAKPLVYNPKIGKIGTRYDSPEIFVDLCIYELDENGFAIDGQDMEIESFMFSKWFDENKYFEVNVTFMDRDDIIMSFNDEREAYKFMDKIEDECGEKIFTNLIIKKAPGCNLEWIYN